MSRGARIHGIGEYRPARAVDNDEIAAAAAVSVEWIESRSGIQRRRHAGPDETLVAMGTAAGAAALADAGVPAVAVDLVIVATATARRPIPATAPQVAANLGARQAGAFDINAACAGFTYALGMAAAAVQTGAAEHVVVVGTERLTDWTSPAVPDTFALLGDGAGAVVVSPGADGAIGPPVWGSDGARRDVIAIPDDGYQVRMDGPLVYRWAVTTMPDVALAACKLADVSPDQLAWLVPHQANGRIVAAIAEAIGVPAERVVYDLVDAGNTSSASVPLALARLRRDGATSGDRALLIGFGAGLTYAAQVVTLP